MSPSASRLSLMALLAALFVVAAAPSAGAASTPDRQLAAWIKQVTAVKPPVRLKGRTSSVKIPARLRRSLPALTRKATKLARRAAAVDPVEVRGRNFSHLATVAAGGTEVLERMDLPSRNQVVDGVELSATATLTKYADGTVNSEYRIEAQKGGYTIRFTPIIDMKSSGIAPVDCPTAAGQLTLDDVSVDGGTMLILKGRKVIASRTVRTTTTTRAEGRVGRDARLADVKTAHSRKHEHYERGLQIVTSFKRQYKLTREGKPVGGAPEVKVSIKAAQATRSQVKAAEKAHAKDQAEGDYADMASWADLARWRMLQDEYKWYQLPNYCARASLDPNGIRLQEGQSTQVTGSVTAKEGGEGAGSFEVTSVARGKFVARKGAVDPGAPAEFTATGAAPDDSGSSVVAEVVATSTAGRAIATFNAEGELVNVPTSFKGWVESTTTGDGLKYHFDAMLEFRRTYVNTGPGGFATAWYELVAITAEHESYNELGPAGGCRWVAKAASGNTINSGDVELRRASTSAPWTYAIQVDLSVLDQTFKPTDCPPGAELPAYTGDIVNQLYTAPHGNFREIWSGSTETDMRLIEMTPVSDVRGPGEYPTTANWGLIGSWE